MKKEINLGIELSDEELMDMVGGGFETATVPVATIKPIVKDPTISMKYGITVAQPLYGIAVARPLYGIAFKE